MGLGRAIRRLPIVSRGSVKEPVQLPDEPAGVPPNIDFATLFDTFFTPWYNHPDRKSERTRGIFHPSSGLHSSTGLCERSLIFELVFAPMSPTNIFPKLAKVLDSGSNRHVGLQRVFHNMAKAQHMGVIHFEDEALCKHPWLPLSGRTDGLVVTNWGWRYLVDFKTWSSKNCEKTFEPEWKHKVQLNTYMGILGVKAGYMIYENKDNQTWLGPPNKFRVNFDTNLFAETEAFCVEVLTLVSRQEMPAFDEKVCKDNLTFCPYQGICDQEKLSQVVWDDFDMRDDPTKLLHHEASLALR